MNRQFAHYGLAGLALTVSFATAVADGPKFLLVAIGDSTTAGTPFFRSPLEAPPDGLGDPQGAYAYWMMHKRPRWEVLNYGVAGETSTKIRNRLGDALNRNPRCVIILAGVNDIYQDVPVNTVAENLLAMYVQAEGMSILPVAATVPPFDRATPAQARAIEALNRWIEKTADKMHIPIADLNAAVSDPHQRGHLDGSPDGFHPDIGGYRKMGLALIAAIDPIEKTWR